jgi:drug/metabolite transporter (DMT)-like permease
MERAAQGVPGPLRVAVVLILLESVALVGAAGVLVVKTIGGRPGDALRALIGAALALVGAAALAFGARALLRLRPAARSPIVVLQLLALPVSYSLWFQAGRAGYGAPIMVVAIAVLFLLFTPPVREALDREIVR